MRYFLDIAYQGTHYHGWQIQENAHSVQAEIQSKLSLILHQATDLVGSGRTDTGVHAEQQIAHFDTQNLMNPFDIVHRLNSALPTDIAVKNIYPVAPDAHARFDACKRSYEYRISLRKNPFLREYSYHYRQLPDVSTMNKAAELLLNYTDFQSFSKVKTEVKHFFCQIYQAKWSQEGDLLIFSISADRFLRGMVRAIVGTLLDVGLQKLNLDDFEKVIQNRDRKHAGWAVPPQGLFLTEVLYPFELKQADIHK